MLDILFNFARLLYEDVYFLGAFLIALFTALIIAAVLMTVFGGWEPEGFSLGAIFLSIMLLTFLTRHQYYLVSIEVMTRTEFNNLFKVSGFSIISFFILIALIAFWPGADDFWKPFFSKIHELTKRVISRLRRKNTESSLSSRCAVVKRGK